MSDLFGGPGGPKGSRKGSIWRANSSYNEGKATAKRAKRAVKKAVKKQAKKAVRRVRKKTMKAGDAIGRALSQQRAKEKTSYAKAQDLIKTYGENAHQHIGVSKQTLANWTAPKKKDRKKPSKASQRKIDAAHDSSTVRAATLARRKAAEISAKGATVKVSGDIGPGGDRKYLRHRTISASLPPEATKDILAAWQAGGAEKAQQAVSDALAQHYFGDKDQTVLMENLDAFEFNPAAWFGDSEKDW